MAKGFSSSSNKNNKQQREMAKVGSWMILRWFSGGFRLVSGCFLDGLLAGQMLKCSKAERRNTAIGGEAMRECSLINWNFNAKLNLNKLIISYKN